MNKYLPVVGYALIIIGNILSLITLMVYGKQGFILTMTSYACFILFLSGVLISMINTLVKAKATNFEIIKNNIGPVVAVLGLMVYSVVLINQNVSTIESGINFNDYYLFSRFNISLTAVIIDILLVAMSTSSFLTNYIVPIQYSTFIYFLLAIQLYIIYTLRNIIVYFTTDG